MCEYVYVCVYVKEIRILSIDLMVCVGRHL